MQGDHHRVRLVCQVEEALLLAEQIESGRPRVRHIQNLHLRDHHRFGGTGPESPRLAHDLGHETRGRYHRWLFDGHGDEIIAPIDGKVGRDAKWQGVRADDIFDHLVCTLVAQTGARQQCMLGLIQASPFSHPSRALLDVQLVEPRQTRAFHFALLHSIPQPPTAQIRTGGMPGRPSVSDPAATGGKVPRRRLAQQAQKSSPWPGWAGGSRLPGRGHPAWRSSP